MTWDLIGHDWAVQLLRGHIRNKSLRHAYLITGPKGIGKAALAVRFIQALSCPDQGSAAVPCQACPTCAQINRLEHPDLFPISVGEDSKQIKVDQIRELIHNLSLSPYAADRRFGLLIDFEQANPNAQNALLKTLEEPPGSVILILTATSADLLLQTISSRCEEIKLNPVPLALTSQGLADLHRIPEDEAHFLAHISGGKPEIALAMHADPDILNRRSMLLDEHIAILHGNSIKRFAYAEQISSDPRKIEEMLDSWVSIWQDILHRSSQSEAPLVNIDREEDINTILDQIDLGVVKDVLVCLRRAKHLFGINANTKLTLEDLFLGLPTLKNRA